MHGRGRNDGLSPANDPEVLERRKLEWLGLAAQPSCARTSVGDSNTAEASPVSKPSQQLPAKRMLAAKGLVSRLRHRNGGDDLFDAWPISVLGLDENEQRSKPATQYSEAESYESVGLIKEQTRDLHQPWNPPARESIWRLSGSAHMATVRVWQWLQKQSRLGSRIPDASVSAAAAAVRVLSRWRDTREHNDSKSDLTSGVAGFAGQERRVAVRRKVNLPSTVALVHAVTSEPAITKDISIHGVFLYAEHANYLIGSILNILVLEQLHEVVRYRGRVVRLDNGAGQQSGLAAVILGCEHLGTISDLTSELQGKTPPE
jgi:hypothetical protein